MHSTTIPLTHFRLSFMLRPHSHRVWMTEDVHGSRSWISIRLLKLRIQGNAAFCGAMSALMEDDGGQRAPLAHGAGNAANPRLPRPRTAIPTDEHPRVSLLFHTLIAHRARMRSCRSSGAHRAPSDPRNRMTLSICTAPPVETTCHGHAGTPCGRSRICADVCVHEAER